MAQCQLNSMSNKKQLPEEPKSIDKSTKLKEKRKSEEQIIIIKGDITITIYSHSIHLKQTDSTGKTSSITINKQNWFQLLFYQNLIESCFHQFDVEK